MIDNREPGTIDHFKYNVINHLPELIKQPQSKELFRLSTVSSKDDNGKENNPCFNTQKLDATCGDIQFSHTRVKETQKNNSQSKPQHEHLSRILNMQSGGDNRVITNMNNNSTSDNEANRNPVSFARQDLREAVKLSKARAQNKLLELKFQENLCNLENNVLDIQSPLNVIFPNANHNSYIPSRKNDDTIDKQLVSDQDTSNKKRLLTYKNDKTKQIHLKESDTHPMSHNYSSPDPPVDSEFYSFFQNSSTYPDITFNTNLADSRLFNSFNGVEEPCIQNDDLSYREQTTLSSISSSQTHLVTDLGNNKMTKIFNAARLPIPQNIQKESKNEMDSKKKQISNQTPNLPFNFSVTPQDLSNISDSEKNNISPRLFSNTFHKVPSGFSNSFFPNTFSNEYENSHLDIDQSLSLTTDRVPPHHDIKNNSLHTIHHSSNPHDYKNNNSFLCEPPTTNIQHSENQVIPSIRHQILEQRHTMNTRHNSMSSVDNSIDVVKPVDFNYLLEESLKKEAENYSLHHMNTYGLSDISETSQLSVNMSGVNNTDPSCHPKPKKPFLKKGARNPLSSIPPNPAKYRYYSHAMTSVTNSEEDSRIKPKQTSHALSRKPLLKESKTLLMKCPQHVIQANKIAIDTKKKKNLEKNPGLNNKYKTSTSSITKQKTIQSPIKKKSNDLKRHTDVSTPIIDKSNELGILAIGKHSNEEESIPLYENGISLQLKHHIIKKKKQDHLKMISKSSEEIHQLNHSSSSHPIHSTCYKEIVDSSYDLLCDTTKKKQMDTNETRTIPILEILSELEKQHLPYPSFWETSEPTSIDPIPTTTSDTHMNNDVINHQRIHLCKDKTLLHQKKNNVLQSHQSPSNKKKKKQDLNTEIIETTFQIPRSSDALLGGPIGSYGTIKRREILLQQQQQPLLKDTTTRDTPNVSSDTHQLISLRPHSRELEVLAIQAQAKIATVDEQITRLKELQHELDKKQHALDLERQNWEKEADQERLSFAAERESQLIEIELEKESLKKGKKKLDLTSCMVTRLEHDKNKLDEENRKLRLCITQLQEGFSAREERYQKLVERLGNQVHVLEKKNKSLIETCDGLEQTSQQISQRLQQQQKKAALKLSTHQSHSQRVKYSKLTHENDTLIQGPTTLTHKRQTLPERTHMIKKKPIDLNKTYVKESLLNQNHKTLSQSTPILPQTSRYRRITSDGSATVSHDNGMIGQSMTNRSCRKHYSTDQSESHSESMFEDSCGISEIPSPLSQQTTRSLRQETTIVHPPTSLVFDSYNGQQNIGTHSVFHPQEYTHRQHTIDHTSVLIDTKPDMSSSIQTIPEKNKLPLTEFQSIIQFNLEKEWHPLDHILKLLTLPDALSLHSPTIHKPDGRQELTYKDGHREIIFANGMRKIVCPNGWILNFFSNGDIRGADSNGQLYYYFHHDTIYNITTPDGLVYNSFTDGQIDCRYPNNKIQVRFPQGLLKQIDPDGTEHIQYYT